MKILILFFVFMHVMGCSTTTKRLSDEDKRGIKAVYIDSYVPKVPTMHYLGPDDSQIFGAINSTDSDKFDTFLGDALKIFIKQNNIYVEKIVEQEMRKAFEKSERFPIVQNKDNANTFVKLSISFYGFSIPTGFDSDVVPIIRINCMMYNDMNKLIWMTSYGLHPSSNPVEPISVYDMKTNPEIISKSWRNGSKYLATKILLDLDLSDKKVGQEGFY